MALTDRVLIRVAIVFLVCCAAGCANLKPVRDYAAQGHNVVVLFKPMVGAREEVCRTNVKYNKVLSTNRPLDSGWARNIPECAASEEAKVAVAKVVGLIASYYETLAEAAGADLPASLNAGIKDFTGTLGRIKVGDEALWSDKQIKAATNLATYLSNILISAKQQAVVKDLLAQEEDLGNALSMLRTYVDQRYRRDYMDFLRSVGPLDEYLNGMQSALEAERERRRKDKDKTEKMEENLDTLRFGGVRLARWDLLEEQAARKKGLEAADAFDKAVTSLMKAHGDVRRKIDKLDDAELLSQLLELRAQVRTLKDQIDEAF
jgi:hypothetical protein